MYDCMINTFIVFVFPLSWMAHKMENVNVRTKEQIKEKSCVVYNANVQYMFNMKNWKLTSLFLDFLSFIISYRDFNLWL